MIKLVKRILAFFAVIVVSLFLIVPSFAASTDLRFEAPGQILSPEEINISNLPSFLITLLFIVGVIIAIVFLIYGGIKWILSGGDSKQVEGARNHIVAAIVGLIIVVAAFFILNFVFSIITGKPFSLSNLCIPSLTTGSCPGAKDLELSPVPTAT